MDFLPLGWFEKGWGGVSWLNYGYFSVRKLNLNLHTKAKLKGVRRVLYNMESKIDQKTFANITTGSTYTEELMQPQFSFDNFPTTSKWKTQRVAQNESSLFQQAQQSQNCNPQLIVNKNSNSNPSGVNQPSQRKPHYTEQQKKIKLNKTECILILIKICSES